MGLVRVFVIFISTQGNTTAQLILDKVNKVLPSSMKNIVAVCQLRCIISWVIFKSKHPSPHRKLLKFGKTLERSKDFIFLI